LQSVTHAWVIIVGIAPTDFIPLWLVVYLAIPMFDQKDDSFISTLFTEPLFGSLKNLCTIESVWEKENLSFTRFFVNH
jgi:hypothetical protein